MKTGIYIHIPFCKQKCPYCDFYSRPASQQEMQCYANVLHNDLDQYSGRKIEADSLYFGGGTPVLMDADLLCGLVEKCRKVFRLSGEVTIEANPSAVTRPMLRALHHGGVNRISFGMQSGVLEECQLLGRSHTPGQVEAAVRQAKDAGFTNISVDLMLGIPKQTAESLVKSLDFINSLKVQHVSAYMLKIEEHTPFYHSEILSKLPSEDAVCDSYLDTVERLESYGFRQYEISNFAKPGYECRHNLKYWKRSPYLGFGPSAHSFFEGKRFAYPRSFTGYLSGRTYPEIDNHTQPAWAETLMLGLRLNEGINLRAFSEQFGAVSDTVIYKSKRYCDAGMMHYNGVTLRFTPTGFLVSNSILADLLDESFSGPENAYS